MNAQDFKMPKWPLWKRALRVVLDCFELEDHEYIRLSLRGRLFPWPFCIWITVLEPSYRYKWHRKLMPCRFRIALATLIRQWVWSQCTICDSRFTLRELLRREGLTHFMSGSICHNACPDPAAAEKHRQQMFLHSRGWSVAPMPNYGERWSKVIDSGFAIQRTRGEALVLENYGLPTPETHVSGAQTNG